MALGYPIGNGLGAGGGQQAAITAGRNPGRTTWVGVEGPNPTGRHRRIQQRPQQSRRTDRQTDRRCPQSDSVADSRSVSSLLSALYTHTHTHSAINYSPPWRAAMYTSLLAAAASKCFLLLFLSAVSSTCASVAFSLQKRWRFFFAIFLLFFFLFFFGVFAAILCVTNPYPLCWAVPSLPRDAGRHSGTLWAGRGSGGRWWIYTWVGARQDLSWASAPRCTRPGPPSLQMSPLRRPCPGI